jgi:hypothetical protein
MDKPKLTLNLDDNTYRMVSFRGGGWRLTRVNGVGAYDLAAVNGRITCTCGDYLHRQAKSPPAAASTARRSPNSD